MNILLEVDEYSTRVRYEYIYNTRDSYIDEYSTSAGPESLEDYFQEGALLGKKAALNLWYVYTRPNSQKLFPSI